MRARFELIAPAALFAALSAYAQSDTVPPSLTNFDFTPKAVNVTNGPAPLSCQISASDTLSGVSFALCWFKSPSLAQEASCSSQSPSSGTSQNGTWSCSTAINQYAEAGIWFVDHVSLFDSAGNFTNYTTQQLASGGYPTQLQVTSVQDVAPPTLTGFDFTPKAVNVTNGPAPLSCQISASDTLSGVSFALCWFKSPSLAQEASCSSQSPSSGTSQNGTWSCSTAINQYAEAGTWFVDHVSLFDSAGNFVNHTTQQLTSGGYPTQLQVTSVQDVAPPTLTGFDFTPKSVDVTDGSAPLSCQISASDTLSGVSFALCWFKSPSRAQEASCSSNSPASGTTHNGNWLCSTSINEHAESGTWVVDHVSLIDSAQNQRTYSTGDLAHLQFPTELHVCADHLGRDSDNDGWGDDCDNCPSTSNVTQSDIDSDGVGDACDDCVLAYNPSQSDLDHNGVGDHCDLNDGLIYVIISDKDYIDWQNEGGMTSWNVYEGDLGVLRSTGIYTQVPGSNPLADRRCGLGINYVDNYLVPSPGAIQFSLVAGRIGVTEGSLGTNNAGTPRPNTNPCP